MNGPHAHSEALLQHVAGSSDAADARSAPFAIRILKGKTAYPVRPVNGPRFLIGAGSNCHLKLGGEIPMVHSVITRSADSLRIERLVESPPLLVGGRECRDAELHVGDRLEIGPFRLEVCMSEGATAPLPVSPSTLSITDSASKSVEAAELSEVDAAPVADELEADPRELSIHELVDRLQSALTRLDDLERQRRRGLTALLDAVARTFPSHASQGHPDADSAQSTAQRRSA